MFAGGENPDWKWRPEKSIKFLMIGPTINYEAAATSVELIAQKNYFKNALLVFPMHLNELRPLRRVARFLAYIENIKLDN